MAGGDHPASELIEAQPDLVQRTDVVGLAALAGDHEDLGGAEPGLQSGQTSSLPANLCRNSATNRSRSAAPRASPARGSAVSSLPRRRSMADSSSAGLVSYAGLYMSHSFGPREPCSVHEVVDRRSEGHRIGARLTEPRQHPSSPSSKIAVNVGELRTWRDRSQIVLAMLGRIDVAYSGQQLGDHRRIDSAVNAARIAWAGRRPERRPHVLAEHRHEVPLYGAGASDELCDGLRREVGTTVPQCFRLDLLPFDLGHRRRGHDPAHLLRQQLAVSRRARASRARRTEAPLTGRRSRRCRPPASRRLT